MYPIFIKVYGERIVLQVECPLCRSQIAHRKVRSC